MVLNYPLQCFQQLPLDNSVFQFIQYCPSSTPICSSGGENGFEKSPWGLDKLPPSLSDLLCSLCLSLSLCGRWRFISESTRSRLKQMLITIVRTPSLLLYLFLFIWLGSSWFYFYLFIFFFWRGSFLVLPMNKSHKISWPNGRCVFALIYLRIGRCEDTHFCEQSKSY